MNRRSMLKGLACLPLANILEMQTKAKVVDRFIGKINPPVSVQRYIRFFPAPVFRVETAPTANGPWQLVTDNQCFITAHCVEFDGRAYLLECEPIKLSTA